LWRERFNSDPSIIGKPITLSRLRVPSRGVMPPGFNYPNNTDVWQRLQWGLRAAQPRRAFRRIAVPAQARRHRGTRNADLRALTTRLGRSSRRRTASGAPARCRWRTKSKAISGRRVRAVRRRRVSAVDYLYQRGEPSARARDGARTRGSRCAPRLAPAADASCGSS
jgi:hypothetical protein